jgi:hypothetical protein
MKNKICGIYKITSPSGKIYIGESDNIKQRWYTYKSLSCRNQPKLYASLNKYDPKNHTYEIIELCNFELLHCRERYWQEFYEVMDEGKGLNLKLTECGCKKQLPSSEVRVKIRNTKIKQWKNKTKKIYQYNLDGSFIKTWDSIRDIRENLGISFAYIRRQITKDCPKACNYLWSHSDRIFSEEIIKRAKLTRLDKMKGHKFNLGKKRKYETNSKGETYYKLVGA